MEAISFIIAIIIMHFIAKKAHEVRTISYIGAFAFIFFLGIIGIMIVFFAYNKRKKIEPAKSRPIKVRVMSAKST